jgi:hypothetical protein
MNPTAVLALIGDLYSQLTALQAQVDKLTEDKEKSDD